MKEPVKKRDLITALTLISMTFIAIILSVSYYVASGWIG